MKKIKGPCGIDLWVPEDKQEEESIRAIAEIQGQALLLHYGDILRPTELKSQSQQLELQHRFTIEEIEGLRADVYREDRHIQKQLDELKK